MNRRQIVAIVGTLLALLVLVGGTLIALFAPASPFYVGSTTGGTPGTGRTGSGVTATPAVGATSTADKGCGITKTADGYTFSPLHVANAALMSNTNCIVDLKGFNWSQLEFGNAVGGGVKTRINAQAIAWYNQTFHMNVWRIPVNSYWWNTNVDVPLAHMSYQSWIEQIVQWAKQNGDYVILTKGPQFHAPPCGGGVTLCPAQNYGLTTGDPTQMASGADIADAVTMWTSIAGLYKNDPAVLYDSWNEMHGLNAQMWQQQENTLINTIRGQNANAPIFLGGPNDKGNVNALVENQVPDFTQSNLIYDFHVYDGFNGEYMGKRCQAPNSYLWKNWPTNADQQVQFSQQHGKAVAISEWGGCNDLSQYNQDITSYARQHNISMVYYDETGVATLIDGTYQITSNGQEVQAAYATF
jgi:hypothetical protein